MIQRRSGFTLIELVVTLAIVALLAVIVIPMAEVNVQRKKETDYRHALREIRSAIDAYKRAADEGRIDKPADASGYPPNLDVLVNGVVDARNPKGGKIYFLRQLPSDPLTDTDDGSPAATTWGKRSYASAPDSPQEGVDVFDVFSRSTKVGLNGIPYRKW